MKTKIIMIIMIIMYIYNIIVYIQYILYFRLSFGFVVIPDFWFTNINIQLYTNIYIYKSNNHMYISIRYDTNNIEKNLKIL